jgi:hypothetical protein
MKLPAGATGFHGPSDDGASLRAFTGICHQAARAIGGAVTEVTPAGVTPSFHTVHIAQRGRRIAVLRHSTLPLVAIAHPRVAADTVLAFVDHPDLAAAIAQASDLQILTAERLHVPLSAIDIGALHPHELEQIAYWQPHTIGELLFNFWD